MKQKTMLILCLAVIFGQIFVQNGHCGGGPIVAVYWLNGRLTAMLAKGHSSSIAIAISGSTLHIVGRYGYDDVAVYWINGEMTVLPTTGNSARAWAVAVSGSDVYIAGQDGDDAVYWLNGRRTALPKTGSSASAYAIAVSGSDVYIAGSDDT